MPRCIKFISQRSWFVFTLIGLFIVYAPAIFARWGMHTDYSMLLKDPGRGWWGFIETDHLLAIGRPLNALVSNIVYNTVHSVDDFVWWRLVGFLSMAGFLGVFGLYLRRRLKIEKIWVTISLVLIGLLPASTVFVLWTSVVLQGFINALLAMSAYMVLENVRMPEGKGRINADNAARMWLAFCIFMITLFLYPPTALIVFVFSFLHLIFSEQRDWAATRRRIIFDVSFFGIGLLIYRLLERHVVTPFFLSHQTYRPWQDYYDMGVFQNLFLKINVFLETLCVSTAGPWSFVSSVLGFLIVVLAVYGTVAVAANRSRASHGPQERTVFIERTIAGVVLFFMANLSVILPKHVTYLLGYRLVLAGSVMMVVLLVAFSRRAVSNGVGWVTRLAVGYTAIAACIVAIALSDVVLNYKRELSYVESKLAQADLKQIKHYVFIKLPDPVSLVNRRFDYEYTYMISEVQHLLPLVRSAAEKTNVEVKDSNIVIVRDPRRSIPVASDILVFNPLKATR